MDLFLLNNATIRVACIHGTTLANQARISHGLDSVEGALLGEALLATALCGSNLKEREKISLLLESDGANGGFVTEANTAGHVRGYLRYSTLPADTTNRLGTGSLDVARADAERSLVSRGHVDWCDGPVSWNMERYFALSEQTPSVMQISVETDETGRILGAGGFIAQRMPGAHDKTFRGIRETMSALSTLGRRFSLGQTSPEIVRELFAEWEPRIAATRNVEFFCPCSRERFGQFLGALPREEKEDILRNGPIPLVTVCHNCSSRYAFEEAELRRIFHTPGSA